LALTLEGVSSVRTLEEVCLGANHLQEVCSVVVDSGRHRALEGCLALEEQ